MFCFGGTISEGMCLLIGERSFSLSLLIPCGTFGTRETAVFSAKNFLPHLGHDHRRACLI
jgi:hypothetical protein